MKRVATLLLRLYPRAWRERYGDEIGALLEDGPVRWRVLPDLMHGAMKEQFNMQSFTRLVGWLSAAGLLAGFLASFAITPRYTSQALISLKGPGASTILPVAQSEATSRAILATLINNPRVNLYDEERTRMPMEDVEDEMRHDLDITSPAATARDTNTALIAIAYTYRDPAKAQAALEGMTSSLVRAITRIFRQRSIEDGISTDGDHRYPDEIARLESRIAFLEGRLGIPRPQHSISPAPPVRRAAERIEVLDPPSFPEHPVSPDRAAFAAVGFGAGFAAALVVALSRRRPDSIPDRIALS